MLASVIELSASQKTLVDFFCKKQWSLHECFTRSFTCPEKCPTFCRTLCCVSQCGHHRDRQKECTCRRGLLAHCPVFCSRRTAGRGTAHRAGRPTVPSSQRKTMLQPSLAFILIENAGVDCRCIIQPAMECPVVIGHPGKSGFLFLSIRIFCSV